MRIHARSENRQVLDVLSLTLVANCDYNPDSDYPSEIMAPLKHIDVARGMLQVYENGRKACNSPPEDLSVHEQLRYVIVLHEKDNDSGPNKPLRLWLSEKFLRYAASLEKRAVPDLASSATRLSVQTWRGRSRTKSSGRRAGKTQPPERGTSG